MRIYVVLFILLNFVTAPITIYAQSNNGSGSFRIKYIGEISDNSLKLNKKTWKEKISDLILGHSFETAIIKPISCFAKNLDTLIILDQEQGKLFKIENNKCKILKINKKSDYKFPSLIAICSADNNSFYFTDSQLNKVYHLNAENEIEELNDTFPFNQPTGIAYNTITKEIWVAETASHCISIFNINGNFIKKIGTRGNKPGEFNFPTFITIDKNGKAYISDAMNFRIQIIGSDYKYISTFGKNGDATGYLARPKGIAIDNFGNIYLADAIFHTVQIFNNNGDLLYYFGKQGNNQEEFWMPTGIFINNENYIFVADTYNSRIQIFYLENNK